MAYFYIKVNCLIILSAVCCCCAPDGGYEKAKIAALFEFFVIEKLKKKTF